MATPANCAPNLAGAAEVARWQLQRQHEIGLGVAGSDRLPADLQSPSGSAGKCGLYIERLWSRHPLALH